MNLFIFTITLSVALTFRIQPFLHKKWVSVQFTSFALKDGALGQINLLKKEYDSIKSSLKDNVDSHSGRIKELKILLKSFEALQTIENDLKMVEIEAMSADPTTKESALRFQQEFLDCQRDIEDQLNEVL